MTHQLQLRSISDDELLRRLAELLKQSRRVESELVAHIGEVDERRLYARQAAPFAAGRLERQESSPSSPDFV